MLPGLVEQVRTELVRNGVDVSMIPVGSLPVGEVKNNLGETVFYYAGPETLPEYLMQHDSLIGAPCLLPFKERVEGVEYFFCLSFDNGTKAGFVEVTRLKHYSNTEKEVVRYYHTIHQPTEFSSLPDDCVEKWENWFRKIEVTWLNGVIDSLWEKFSRVEDVKSTHLKKLLKERS